MYRTIFLLVEYRFKGQNQSLKFLIKLHIKYKKRNGKTLRITHSRRIYSVSYTKFFKINKKFSL